MSGARDKRAQLNSSTYNINIEVHLYFIIKTNN